MKDFLVHNPNFLKSHKPHVLDDLIAFVHLRVKPLDQFTPYASHEKEQLHGMQRRNPMLIHKQKLFRLYDQSGFFIKLPNKVFLHGAPKIHTTSGWSPKDSLFTNAFVLYE